MKNPEVEATERDRKAQERSEREQIVAVAVEVYIKVRVAKAGGRDGASHHLRKQYIHKQPNNKYYKIFWRVAEWLIELRGTYTNPLEHLLEDYFTMVFDYLGQYGRIANTSQMGASSANQVRFLDWITDWEIKHDEPYWKTDGRSFEEIQEEARQSMIKANQAKRQLIESAQDAIDADVEINTIKIH